VLSDRVYSGVIAAAWLIWPGAAAAHIGVHGSDGFVTGALRPVMDFSQLLATISVGLFVGWQNAGNANRAAGAFVAELVAGLAGAFWSDLSNLPAGLLHGVAFAGGFLAALARPVPVFFAVTLGGAGGLIIGLALLPGSESVSEAGFALVGGFFTVTLIFIYAVFAVNWLRGRASKPWLLLGLRIAGSWIAAIALMMLALTLRA